MRKASDKFIDHFKLLRLETWRERIPTTIFNKHTMYPNKWLKTTGYIVNYQYFDFIATVLLTSMKLYYVHIYMYTLLYNSYSAVSVLSEKLHVRYCPHRWLCGNST